MTTEQVLKLIEQLGPESLIDILRHWLLDVERRLIDFQASQTAR